jgi:hypothetical protein
MIALAVYLNGRKLTTAGTQDLGVLNTIVVAGGTLGKATATVHKKRSVSLHLSVGGLTNRGGGVEDEHLTWIPLRPLRVGDRISVRIVRTDRPDTPTASTPAARISKSAKERLLRKFSGKRKTKRPSSKRGAVAA